MDSPEQWRWVWIVAAAVFAVGEMSTPGSFFMAPFAVGALVAAALSFAGVSVAASWVAFPPYSVYGASKQTVGVVLVRKGAY